MGITWIVFLDLDGTVWDHLDISVTSPPYNRISETRIEDSKGVQITLLPGAVDFIKWVRTSGGIISTCSWNIYGIAMSALNAFDLIDLFDFHKIYTNPKKYESIEETLESVKKDGKEVRKDMLFYLDDRDIHIKEIEERFPDLTFFHMWKKVGSFGEVKKAILEKVNGVRIKSSLFEPTT
jgi:magnesium-dependent phosphatase-1